MAAGHIHCIKNKDSAVFVFTFCFQRSLSSSIFISLFEFSTTFLILFFASANSEVSRNAVLATVPINATIAPNQKIILQFKSLEMTKYKFGGRR